MTSILKAYTVLLFAVIASRTSAQDIKPIAAANYLNLQWKQVANQLPDEWYASEHAKAVADNVIFCQQDIGGWAKNTPYHHPLTGKDSAAVIRLRPSIGATFDNGATIMEMNFLAKVYSKNPDVRYLESFRKGLNYIFQAQYPNGGWPQFYPFRQGKTVDYASHITYNDNAMVNVMMLLRDITEDKPLYKSLQLSNDVKAKAKEAFEKGVECILKTQIRINGKPTVWCAQHDEITLQPANARAYELASFSGSESAGITLLLMGIKNPSPPIITAINGAVEWFDTYKIEGIKVERVLLENGKRNTIVVKDNNAKAIWARFYDLETGKPFFCDRDGVKKYSLAEIGDERRNGYSWYTFEPEKVLLKFKTWKKSE
jgi:PelA/Pel-15E family pectate lyase